jgi:hypothetical protein
MEEFAFPAIREPHLKASAIEDPFRAAWDDANAFWHPGILAAGKTRESGPAGFNRRIDYPRHGVA